MDIPINITISKIDTKTRVTKGRTDNIKAFGELWFYSQNKENIPICKVKGFTITLKKFPNSEKEFLSVVFPAYGSAKSNTGFQTSFIFENERLLKTVRYAFLKDYANQTGESLPDEIQHSEDISPDDIPF